MLSTIIPTVLAVVLGVALIIRSYRVLRNPSSPGPFAAKWTDIWYVVKVYKGQFHRWNIKQHAQKGNIIRVAPNLYSIDDPAAIKTIYGISTAFTKSSWYDAWGNTNRPNDNLFSVRPIDMHRQMRSKQAGLFNMTSIKSYEPYVDSSIPVLLKQLDAYAESKKPFDLQIWMQRYAFDTVTAITYGDRLGFMDDGGKDVGGIMHTIELVTSFCTMFGMSRVLLPLWIFLIGNAFPGLRKFVALCNASAVKAAESIDQNQDLDAESTKPIPFYHRSEAIRLKDPESFAKFRVESAVNSNIGAGSDTTSIALTSLVHNCLKNKAVWQKLKLELNEAIAEGLVSDPITFTEAQKLPYLQDVIKEALRIHPAVGLPLWRDVPKNGAVISGTVFPAGSVVGINPFVAHMNKEVFGADAETFRPERWDPAMVSKEKLQQMDAYFIPFGCGARTCIGKNISLLEINKLIPELVRRYDLNLEDPEKPLEDKAHWFVKQSNIFATVSLLPEAK